MLAEAWVPKVTEPVFEEPETDGDVTNTRGRYSVGVMAICEPASGPTEYPRPGLPPPVAQAVIIFVGESNSTLLSR